MEFFQKKNCQFRKFCVYIKKQVKILSNFFHISTLMRRLLLWDCDDRRYSYYIQVSGNSKNFELVVDKTREQCHSWQTIRFSPPRPVVFIRIVGTHNTANEVNIYVISFSGCLSNCRERVRFFSFRNQYQSFFRSRILNT